MDYLKWTGLWVLFLLVTACSPGKRSAITHTSTAGAAGFSDLHNSVLYRMFVQEDFTGLDNPDFPVHLKGLSSVSTRFVVFSIGIPRFSMQSREEVSLQQVIAFLRNFRAYTEQQSPELVYVDSEALLQEAHRQEKIAYTFSLEGSWLLQGEIHWLDSLYAAGVRILQPGHRFDNAFFDSPEGGGPVLLGDSSRFSATGWELLDRANRLGMILDLSHLPPQAFRQVVESNSGHSRLIVSHANAHAICPTSRNLTDAQIRAIAQTDGLIGVCLHQPLLNADPKVAGMEAVTDHIEYLVKVAGPDHVCLGTDLEGNIRPAQGLEKIENMAKIRKELLKRGMAPGTVEKVMWQNAQRIWTPRN